MPIGLSCPLYGQGSSKGTGRHEVDTEESRFKLFLKALLGSEVQLMPNRQL